jgi:hypothetical protein
MNMGGIGKGTTAPKEVNPTAKNIIEPATDAIQKAATAGRLKSIKLKVKFNGKKKQQSGDAS